MKFRRSVAVITRVLPVCLCVILCNVSSVAFGASGATGAVASTVSASDALWQDARTALNARQYPKARTLFNEFLKKFQTDPRALEAQIYIGICDYRQGSVPRAVNTWTRAVNMELLQKRRSPALLLGLEQLVAHWQKQNKRAEHEKTLAQMGELFPDEPATHRAHLAAAVQRFEAGDYAAAAALYARAGALSGRNAENYQLSLRSLRQRTLIRTTSK